MIQGFDDCAKEAETNVVGGQTVYNPWPMIGGAGIAAVSESEFLMPTRAEPGDVIIMTKALGT
jgi:selenide,water dikinase